MIGTIIISNLRVHCIIGILTHEREHEQNIFLDLEVDYDFEKVRNSGNINDTMDYTMLAKSIENILINKKYQLIETAAEDIALLIFQEWKMAIGCSVQIKKPDAIPSADFASVKVVRKNTLKQ